MLGNQKITETRAELRALLAQTEPLQNELDGLKDTLLELSQESEALTKDCDDLVDRLQCRFSLDSVETHLLAVQLECNISCLRSVAREGEREGIKAKSLVRKLCQIQEKGRELCQKLLELKQEDPDNTPVQEPWNKASNRVEKFVLNFLLGPTCG
jgi:DNA repair exonuclease SbcCD ATPase subunit